MDEEKFEKWIRDFHEEMVLIEISYAAYFKNVKLIDYCTLEPDYLKNELILRITSGVPEEIKERLMKAIIDTKPEDSL